MLSAGAAAAIWDDAGAGQRLGRATAIAWLRSAHPGPDLVVWEVLLGGRKGTELVLAWCRAGSCGMVPDPAASPLLTALGQPQAGSARMSQLGWTLMAAGLEVSLKPHGSARIKLKQVDFFPKYLVFRDENKA